MAPFGALLFASGLCALVYQTVWLRAFRAIFGASTPATAAVLAIFMGGLGLGSWWLGRYAERHPRPLRLYALLEAGITLGAALSPLLIWLVRAVYLGVGGSPALGSVGATILRLALAPLVLALPVVLMGGTLPALGRAITHAGDPGRRGVALLYGCNALGAMVGALLPTFLTFEAWGVRATLFAACALNALVAAAAWALAARTPPMEVTAEASATSPEAPALPAPTEAAAPTNPSSPADPAEALPPQDQVLLAAGATGFSFLLAELVWYRLAGPILGGSTYTFGIILALALLGIGAGGVLYAFFAPARPRAAHFGLSCALYAVALLLPYALGDHLAFAAQHLHDWGKTSFPTLVLGWGLLGAVLVLPAALVSGYQFPLLLALRGRGAEHVASDVGQVYATNTLGAILGSLAGGFGLLPLLGALAAWKLAAALVLGVGLTFAVVLGRREPQGKRLAAAAAALAVLTLLLARAAGPSAAFRHHPIGAGRGELVQETWNREYEAVSCANRTLLGEVEGRESALGFVLGNGVSLFVNGKSDGNVIYDARTTFMLGLQGAIQHAAPRRAFVVGLASGVTAAALAEVPGMEHVDVAELEPGVLEFAELVKVANWDVLHHPKVSVLIGDGRELLQASREGYDLIVSEPSNPYRAGIAGFYSLDFYRQTHERLRPGGLLCQWLQSYDLDPAALALVLATLRQVYAHVGFWALRGDFLLIASDHPQVFDVARVRERLGQEPFRTAFGRVCGVWDVEGVAAMHVGSTPLIDLVLPRVPAFNSDDHPLLEFSCARTAGRNRHFPEAELLKIAQAAGGGLQVTNGALDAQRVAFVRARDWIPPPEVALSDADRRRLELWRLYERNELGPANAVVDRVPEAPPHDLYGRLARAEVRCYRRAPLPALDAELAELERLGLGGEVAWLRLVRAALLNQAAQLGPLGRVAFEAARRDPWIPQRLMKNVLMNVMSLAPPAPPAAELSRLLIGEPLACWSLERERRGVAAKLAERAGELSLASHALLLNEPYPFWSEDWLELRARVYEQTGEPLAARARADLELFRSREGPSLRDVFGK
ncbi:MAG: spermidine synthase [Planctomycetota bacterium]